MGLPRCWSSAKTLNRANWAVVLTRDGTGWQAVDLLGASLLREPHATGRLQTACDELLAHQLNLALVAL